MAIKKKYILAIDSGTQSVRAILFDAQGNVIKKSKVEIEPYFSKKPGWAEQDPEYFWQRLGEACKTLWENSTIKPEQVIGVGLTTQRGTVVNLDKDGLPLRPAILWLDQRRANAKKIGGFWGVIFKLLRLERVIETFQAKSQAAWIEQNQPDIWKNTHKFLLLSGYLTYRLTGEFKDSTGCTVGYLPFDYKYQKWETCQNWKWQVAKINQDMLPKLHSPGELLGHIHQQAAEHTGISVGTPLIASASDKACEILGSGVIDHQIGCLSYGTTATISTTNKRYIEPFRFFPSYPAAIPNAYTTEIMIYRGFWMVSWFKNEFGLAEQQRAQLEGVTVESLFDKLLEATPAGCDGLMLQPYWTPGTWYPGVEAKGAIIGFGDAHNRAHVYRAIIEGIVFGLREGKEQIERRANVKITKLRASGGGAQSDAVMQLTADVFGMTVERPRLYETSALGAAVNVAVGLNIFENYKDAIQAMTSVSDTFLPNTKSSDLYEKLYKQVYLRMYKRLQPIYRSIHEITQDFKV